VTFFGTQCTSTTQDNVTQYSAKEIRSSGYRSAAEN